MVAICKLCAKDFVLMLVSQSILFSRTALPKILLFLELGFSNFVSCKSPRFFGHNCTHNQYLILNVSSPSLMRSNSSTTRQVYPIIIPFTWAVKTKPGTGSHCTSGYVLVKKFMSRMICRKEKINRGCTPRNDWEA